jgi:hypothetical protein
MRPLSLAAVPGVYAVCRLSPDAEVPAWAIQGSLWSLMRTPEELAVVCPQDVVPAEVRHEPGWRALRVAGTLAFSEVGVLATLAMPLATVGVSILVLSSFDTDYLFVRAGDWQRTVDALREAGHAVT